MATTSKMYGNFLLEIFSKKIDYINDNVKIMLCTSAYTPDQDAHIFKNQVTNEISGTGYTAGGASLKNKSIVYDAATNTVRLFCDDVTWVGASFTCRKAVVYIDAGDSATSPLIGYIEFDTDQVVNVSDFTIKFDTTNGLATIVIS